MQRLSHLKQDGLQLNKQAQSKEMTHRHKQQMFCLHVDRWAVVFNHIQAFHIINMLTWFYFSTKCFGGRIATGLSRPSTVNVKQQSISSSKRTGKPWEYDVRTSVQFRLFAIFLYRALVAHAA